MGPSVFIVYLPSMGPHGLCRDIRQIVTWVLPTTMDKVCVMGSQGQVSADKKTRQTYIKSMNGKCFGCGSKDHSKKDRNHERDMCNHCGKVGHRSNICFTKYLGKPGKSAKAGASVENPASSSTTAQAPPAQSASATKNSPTKDICYG